jgi:hypothetical protein
MMLTDTEVIKSKGICKDCLLDDIANRLASRNWLTCIVMLSIAESVEAKLKILNVNHGSTLSGLVELSTITQNGKSYTGCEFFGIT